MAAIDYDTYELPKDIITMKLIQLLGEWGSVGGW